MKCFNKIYNEYADMLGEMYDNIPKAVFAAIAVSAVTGGDPINNNPKLEILREWTALHLNGIVPQKPRKQ